MKLSPQERKLAIGVGVGLVAIGTLAFLLRPQSAAAGPSLTSTAPIDTGIYIHPQCIGWSITNSEKFKATLAQVFDPLVKAGERNPWALARAMLQRVAPQCPSLGASDVPSNASEAQLIYIFVLDATFTLERQKLVSAEEAKSLRIQANAWASVNGVPEDQLYDT
jgi:hypothetical protein